MGRGERRNICSYVVVLYTLMMRMEPFVATREEKLHPPEAADVMRK